MCGPDMVNLGQGQMTHVWLTNNHNDQCVD